MRLQQGEQRLRESEDHLRRITESLGEGLLITDSDDVVLYANTRLNEMTRYTRENLLGRPAYELLLPPGCTPGCGSATGSATATSLSSAR